MPEAIADQCNVITIRQILARRESAATLRLHTQRRQQCRRDARGVHSFCLGASAVVSQVDGRLHPDRDGLQRPCRVRVVEVRPARLRRVRYPDPEQRVIRLDESVRLCIGQWPQQHRVHDPKDRGRRADAQRERQHDGRREQRRALQAAQHVAHFMIPHHVTLESARYTDNNSLHAQRGNAAVTLLVFDGRYGIYPRRAPGRNRSSRKGDDCQADRRRE